MKILAAVLLAAFAVTVGAQTSNQPTPKPEWVPDPSAGHYDCPNGWMAYSPSEPEVPYYGPIAAMYHHPPTDKKGHILGVQPPMPICIKESK